MLDTDHSNRAFSGNDPRQLHPPPLDLHPPAVHHLANPPHLPRLLCAPVPPREAQFPRETLVANTAGKPLERPDIGRETDIDLHDAEGNGGGAEADVACGEDVDAEADAEAVSGGEDGLREEGEGGDGRLEGRDVAVETECAAGELGGWGNVGELCGDYEGGRVGEIEKWVKEGKGARTIEAEGEDFVESGTKDDAADGRGAADFVERGFEFSPESVRECIQIKLNGMD